MFESSEVQPLDLMTGSQLAAAIAENHAELLARECRVLELACAWADLHTREPVEYAPLVERARFFGGPGTPAISEFCVAEWAALQQLGSMAGQALLADALDLRYRLPRLWRQVQAGQRRQASQVSTPFVDAASPQSSNRLADILALATNQGTQSLGTATFAQAVWRAAANGDRATGC